MNKRGDAARKYVDEISNDEAFTRGSSYVAFKAGWDALTSELITLRDDICKHAEDTAWCGPGETIAERLTSLIGDEWPCETCVRK